MAAPESQYIKAVVADSSYADLEEIINYQFLPAQRLASLLYSHHSLHE
jgi:hypothetical protein